MFGISRFLQLVGAERGTGNDFGIKGNPEDIAKVDSFLMVEGIILLVLHILLIIGTCLVRLLLETSIIHIKYF